MDAAADVGVSQSAVSHAIAGLERELGGGDSTAERSRSRGSASEPSCRLEQPPPR